MEKFSISQVEKIIADTFYPSPEERAAVRLSKIGVTEASLQVMVAIESGAKISSNILLKVRNALRNLEKSI